MVILNRLYLLLMFTYCYVNSLESKGTLTFVIDDTDSMSDEIRQVKEKTYEVFDAVLNSNASTIDDFILITFNDPSAPVVRIETRDPKEFKEAVENITVYGGGYCPELAMGGIELALEKSKPNSFLYVFTDASALDFHKAESIIRLSQKKSTKVTFLLTGQCDGPNDEDYVVYDKVAEATFGQVFHIERNDVAEIINFIIASIKDKRTTLGHRKFDRGSGNKLFFAVDSKIWNVFISVTGEDPRFDVIDSVGSVVEMDKITGTKKSNVYKLKQNKPGIYYVKLYNDMETTVDVTGSTSLDFQHGFSSIEPSSLIETSKLPLPDGNTYLSIALDNNRKDTLLESAVLKDKNDNILMGPLKLKLVNKDKQFYITEPFEPPSEMFLVTVNGYIPDTSENITRISSTAIAKRIPTPTPEKEIIKKSPNMTLLLGDTIEANYGENVEIKFKLYGFPKPDVLCQDTSGAIIESSVLPIDHPYDYIIVFTIDKVDKNLTISCKAINLEGEITKSVNVVIKNYLDIMEYPTDVTIEYRNSAQLKFKVNAYPFATIKWLKDNRPLTNNDDFGISPDHTTLTIKSAHLVLKGNYSVEATNGIVEKKIYFNVKISGIEKPKIDKAIDTYFVTQGENFDIPCRLLQGKPQPVIYWEYTSITDRSAESEGDDFNKEFDGETFQLENVTESNKGTYKCYAENEFGSDSHKIKLYINSPPSIEILNTDEKYITKKEGDLVNLICLAGGFPYPKIRWLKNGTAIKKKSKYWNFRKYKISFRASVKDSDIYTCQATNSLATVEEDIHLNVYAPVMIETPSERVFNLEVESNLTLPCVTSGYPKPEVIWTFQHFDTKILPKTLRADKLNSVTIEDLQLEDEGYYTCEANNHINKTRIIYEVHAAVKPWIENKFEQKIFDVVVGDLALRIPCKAGGKPKPNISWTVNGLMVAYGTIWYDLEEDGTLVIKNIKTRSEGTYSCKAENILGSATENFEVVVHGYPDKISDPVQVLLEEGSPANIECDLTHKAIDQVLWFKDGNVISNNFTIYLAKVSISDAGIYSCRVSDFMSSRTSHKIITVGYKPDFLTNEETNIEFYDGATTLLECNAAGKPNPTVTWWHNGRRINETSFSYFVKMNVRDIGIYTCEVLNVFGIIKRHFEISDKKCLLNIENDFNANQPLVLSLSKRWPKFEYSDGFLRIPKHEQLVLLCPESNLSYGKFDFGEEGIATCIGNSRLQINRRIYDFKNLKCKRKIKSLAKATGAICSEGNTELLKVGFSLDSEFLGVYDVCFDKDNQIPIYTKHDLHQHHAGFVPRDVVKYSTSKYLPSDIDESFNTCEGDECCYFKRQLVSPRDVLPGMSQISTYNYLNVLPQWSTCGTENWDEIERRIRSLVKTLDYSLVVWTGSFYITNLKLRMEEGSGREFLWKVVQDLQEEQALAIIQANDPEIDPTEAASYILCKDICDDIEWMRNPNWRDVEKGFTICCSIEDFEEVFGYNMINRHTDVLNAYLPEFKLI